MLEKKGAGAPRGKEVAKRGGRGGWGAGEGWFIGGSKAEAQEGKDHVRRRHGGQKREWRVRAREGRARVGTWRWGEERATVERGLRGGKAMAK